MTNSRKKLRGNAITTVIPIPSDEIHFHPHSFADQGLRLFQWRGQLYRGISSERTRFFRELFKNGIIQGLVQKGLLIESELTPLAVDGYETVIHHRRIPFASYPNEWCPAMLKDSALTIIDLAIELAHHGFTLGDAHPWNVLFDIDSGKPIFVDLGSIGPIDDFTWSVYEEFCRFCLHPLILMAHGEDQIARLLMCEDSGVMESDISKLMGDTVPLGSRSRRSLIYRLESIVRKHIPLSYRTWFKQKLSAIQGLSRGRAKDQKSSSDPFERTRQKSHVDFLVKIRREVESVSLPHTKPKSLGRHETSHLSLSDQEGWTEKQRNLYKMFTELKPSSVLDISSSTGWYSKLAALSGIRVVAWDINPLCTTQLYLDARDMKLPILPLIMDFTKPTPSRGLANHWAIAATDRFQCDMVIALGLVHQLVHKNRLNFEQIVGGLAALSKKWAVLEFIPPEDPEAHPLQSHMMPWYTFDNLLSAVKRHFGSVRPMPSYPESRLLLLCEKL
jgi:hypothetical protein